VTGLARGGGFGDRAACSEGRDGIGPWGKRGGGGDPEIYGARGGEEEVGGEGNESPVPCDGVPFRERTGGERNGYGSGRARWWPLDLWTPLTRFSAHVTPYTSLQISVGIKTETCALLIKAGSNLLPPF